MKHKRQNLSHKPMLRRVNLSFAFASLTATTVTTTSPLLATPIKSFHAAGFPHEGNQSQFSGVNKSNRYVNTQTSAAPIMTACGRKFDPMLFQELIQASCDPQWSSAIQRFLREDVEYVQMLHTEGGGAMAIDQLMLKGLGASDEEAMKNLKKLLETDRKASLSVCAIQDAYQKIRDKRDLNQTKVAAQGGANAASEGLRSQRPTFGTPTGMGGN